MIDDLRSFVAVIEEASLTRAADKLCVTQSAVSRRIQRLEELFGAELFDRNSKPPKVTALAARIYEQAVPVLKSLDRLLEIPQEGAIPSGTLRVGLPQTVAELVLYDAVIDIKRAFPMLDMRIRTDWSSALQRLIEAGSIDAAVLMLPTGATPVDELDRTFLATLKILAVQSSTRPLVTGPTTIKALATQEWILNPEGCGYRSALERAIDETARSLRLSVDTHSIDMQLRLVSEGLGLGLVPETVLARSALRGRLAVLDIADFALSFDIWLVFPRQLGALRRAVELLGGSMTRSLGNDTV